MKPVKGKERKGRNTTGWLGKAWLIKWLLCRNLSAVGEHAMKMSSKSTPGWENSKYKGSKKGLDL